jgi:hypothetical protein
MPRLLAFVAILATLLLAAPTAASPADACDRARTTQGLPDHRPTGNRVVEPCQPLGGASADVVLEARPAWVVAHPERPGDDWVLTLDDGRAFEFREGRTTEIESGLPAGAVAPRVMLADGQLAVRPRADPPGTPDPVPHGRRVGYGSIGAALAGPTDRYPHGVLGDEIEASRLDFGTDIPADRIVELPEHEVIEGISPIVAALSDAGQVGVLVTVSDAQNGARLRAYGEDGRVVGESDPIGQGFRWLHQIGVGPTGPDGEIEVIAVRTPHIGGIVQAFRLEGDRFERVASIEGYSSHAIGSPNLDMALLADTDADGQLEVVVPTQAMTELAVLKRTGDGFAEVMRLPLHGRLATNVAAAVDGEGRLSLAAATMDGRLHVFR